VKIAIAKLRRDKRVMPRELSEDVVEEYAEAMKAGAKFPPVIAFKDGAKPWLSDGFHRADASVKAGVKEIPCELRTSHSVGDIKETGFRAAVLFAAGANSAHGMRRSNANKRASVERLLKFYEKMSNVWIAEAAGVSDKFVGKIRPPSNGSKVVRVGRDGKEYETSQIGPTTAAVEAEQVVEIPPKKEPAKPKFNRTDDDVASGIEWARWSWNPVTGCKHDCAYCYARDIANRFYPERFKPTFRPERLDAPKNMGVPPKEARTDIGERNVFVCSMADLFGRWVPRDWIEAVLEVVRAAPEWNFLFLTKFPLRYCEFEFPKNAWLGTTVEVQARVQNAEKAFAKLEGPEIKWLSCEPLLQPLKFKRLDMFDWVVIGGSSKSAKTPAFQPPTSWVTNLVFQAKEAELMVYFKTNLGYYRPREYPRCEVEADVEISKEFKIEKMARLS
jgi:protein gp37